MQRFFLSAFLVLAYLVPVKAQLAASAELLEAYPLYFDKAESGITSSHLQTGARLGLYKYDDFNEWFNFVYGMRYTHHFTTTDSAQVMVSHIYTTNEGLLSGSAKSVFNSVIPQFGFSMRSDAHPLFSFRFLAGLGFSWARCRYEFPGYDSLTMEYFNPPWWRAGRYNSERKIVGVLPCLSISFAAQYEFRYFFAFANADLSYSTGSFPPTPVSLSAGILVPLKGKED